MLSQLSYGPENRRQTVVGLGRFELPTSRLSGVRSNQLSYRPETPCADADARKLTRTVAARMTTPVDMRADFGKRNEDGGDPPFWPCGETAELYWILSV